LRTSKACGLLFDEVVFVCRHIVEHEGPRALFKGLGPNLVGVAPSRAIYFCAYSQSKEFLNNAAILLPDSAAVHVCAASCAGESTTSGLHHLLNQLQLRKTSKSPSLFAVARSRFLKKKKTFYDQTYQFLYIKRNRGWPRALKIMLAMDIPTCKHIRCMQVLRSRRKQP